MDEDHLEREPEPAPRKRRARIGSLDSIGGVIAELGVVYRGFVRGEIPAAKAQVRKALLSEIRVAVEGVELARRLNELEAIVKAGDPTASNFKPRLVS